MRCSRRRCLGWAACSAASSPCRTSAPSASRCCRASPMVMTAKPRRSPRRCSSRWWRARASSAPAGSHLAASRSAARRRCLSCRRPPPPPCAAGCAARSPARTTTRPAPGCAPRWWRPTIWATTGRGWCATRRRRRRRAAAGRSLVGLRVDAIAAPPDKRHAPPAEQLAHLRGLRRRVIALFGAGEASHALRKALRSLWVLQELGASRPSTRRPPRSSGGAARGAARCCGAAARARRGGGGGGGRGGGHARREEMGGCGARRRSRWRRAR